MNEKGITVLLGFMLLLMILVLFLSIIQVYYIPSILKKAEFDHNEKILSELFDFDSDIVNNKLSPVEFDLGISYPKYLFLVTPQSGSSSISFETFNISIGYEEIYPEKADGSKVYASKRLYVQLHNYATQDVKFVYENTAIFKNLSNVMLIASSQKVFQKGKINIYLINSSLSSISANHPLDILVIPLSHGSEIIARNITVEFESVYPNYWKTLENLGYKVSISGNKVRVKADNATLSINYVYLSSGTGFSLEQVIQTYKELKNTVLKPSRIVKVTYPSASVIRVTKGESLTLGVRVLDQFNNPMRGVYVTSEEGSGYTNSDGEFYVTFTPESTEVVTFEANSLSTSYTIEVVESSGKGIFSVSWLSPNPYNWDVSEGNTREFYLYVSYNSKGVSNATVHISTDSPSIISIPDEVKTNESGIANVKVSAIKNGKANLIATVGGSSAVLELNISGI